MLYYGKIAGTSTSQNKHQKKRLLYKTKNTVPIIFYEEKEAIAWSFLKEVQPFIRLLFQIFTFKHF